MGLGYGGGDVIHRQERSIYVPQRFGDESFFVFIFRGGGRWSGPSLRTGFM